MFFVVYILLCLLFFYLVGIKNVFGSFDDGIFYSHTLRYLVGEATVCFSILQFVKKYQFSILDAML